PRFGLVAEVLTLPRQWLGCLRLQAGALTPSRREQARTPCRGDPRHPVPISSSHTVSKETQLMRSSNKLNILLWVLQGFFALFFAAASGAPKLLLPQAMLAMPLPLPDVFVKFIGVGEILGALGLVLPGLTHVRPGLTPLAALG